MPAEVNSWLAAVDATLYKLWETMCDNCFLLAPAKDVHRSYHDPHLKSNQLHSAQVTLPDQELL